MKKWFAILLLVAIAAISFVLGSDSGAAFLPQGKVVSSSNGANSESLTVHFLDVGQGDAALLLCDGHAMLIDGGNTADSSLIAAYLKEQEVKHLDYIVATHAHEDHVGGLSGALNVSSVDTAYAPVKEYDSKAFQNFVKYVNKQNKQIIIPKAGETFYLGTAKVQVLGPQKEYDTSPENNSSIVLKVTHGSVSFLFTGDAERESEEDILAAGYDLSATVLKVPHHGSESSTYYPFLRAIMPQYAVISVGEENSYGHASDAVLSRLRDANIKVFRTDIQGHIVATSNQDTVVFTTQKQVSSPTNPTQAEGQNQSVVETPVPYYIGNKKTLKVHLPSCHSLPDEAHQIRFETLEEALQQGYLPCGNCLKK